MTGIRSVPEDVTAQGALRSLPSFLPCLLLDREIVMISPLLCLFPPASSFAGDHPSPWIPDHESLGLGSEIQSLASISVGPATGDEHPECEAFTGSETLRVPDFGEGSRESLSLPLSLFLSFHPSSLIVVSSIMTRKSFPQHHHLNSVWDPHDPFLDVMRLGIEIGIESHG